MSNKERLNNFEEALSDIVKEYNDLGAKLQKLRENGDKKSVRFREMLGQKLIYSNILLILKKHNLIEEIDNQGGEYELKPFI